MFLCNVWWRSCNVFDLDFLSKGLPTGWVISTARFTRWSNHNESGIHWVYLKRIKTFHSKICRFFSIIVTIYFYFFGFVRSDEYSFFRYEDLNLKKKAREDFFPWRSLYFTSMAVIYHCVCSIRRLRVNVSLKFLTERVLCVFCVASMG